MKLTQRREWALIAAFMFFLLSTAGMLAFVNMNDYPEKIRQMGFFNISGILFGALFFPLIFPLRELKYSLPVSRYYLRLAPAAILFSLSIILRILGPEFWLSNSPLSAAIAFSNGAVTTFMYGLFVTLLTKNRIFWFALSISLRQIAIFLTPVLVSNFPHSFISPLMFYAVAVLIFISMVLIFVFLFSVSSEEKSLSGAGDGIASALPISDSSKKRFYLPAYLLPLLAAVIFFWTNSFTNKFFMPAQSLYDLDFYPSIALFLSLPIIGFLAGIFWPRNLKLSILVCTVFFLLSPSLLFSGSSQILFLMVYTFNNIAMYMVVIIFPFIMSDLYWKNTRSRGYWAYMLAIIIYIIRINIWIAEGLFKNIFFDNAYTVLLLTLAAIMFYVLSRIFLRALNEPAQPAALAEAPELEILYENRALSFKKHRLTNREAQTAELILQGLSNDYIKEKMSVSLPTVKTNVSNILKKYNVKQRAEFMTKFFK